ncbi:MAG: BMP family ABC transporter substrate-binding protein [Anaerolineales bacterium]|jgi:basic membrane protein A
MANKLLVVLSVVVVASMALAACAPAATAVAPTTAPFRVGFVTDTGGIADKSFNQTQWEGIQRAGKDFNIQVKYIQSTEASQYTPNLTEFASEGYDLIIASGFYLGADLAKVAAQYPNVKYSIVDYGYPDPTLTLDPGVKGAKECIPNVMGQVFKTDQAAYLAGYLAAGMTKTGKLAYYGGAKIPSVTIFGVGFQQGMEAYNKAHSTSVQLLGWDSKTGEGVFTGDFSDLTKAKATATSLYDEGADIVMGVGGLIGSPSFALAREHNSYGIWVDTDGFVRWPEDQDVMLTSIMKKMDQSNYDLIKATMAGSFAGCTNYIGSLANGGVDIADYHNLASKVPDSLKAEVAALKAKIISGEIKDTGCISYPNQCPGGLYTP